MTVNFVIKCCTDLGGGGQDLLDDDCAGRSEGQEELILEK